MNLKIAEKKMGFIEFFFKSCREEYKKYYSGKINKIPSFIFILSIFIILSVIIIFIINYSFPDNNMYLEFFGILILLFFMLFLIFELTIKFFSYYIYEKVKNKINHYLNIFLIFYCFF